MCASRRPPERNAQNRLAQFASFTDPGSKANAFGPRSNDCFIGVAFPQHGTQIF
jgi:hypothetical protein